MGEDFDFEDRQQIRRLPRLAASAWAMGLPEQNWTFCIDQPTPETGRNSRS